MTGDQAGEGIFSVPDPPGGPMIDGPCPNASAHTPAPTGYLAWHEWAEKKGKTHKQVLCPGCGLYKVWVPKRARGAGTAQRSTPAHSDRADSRTTAPAADADLRPESA